MALEVKYHKRCYEHYTSFLRHANPKDAIKYKFNKSFECFSSWVKKEVIENENIFYMRKLKEVFIKTVMEMENEDASHYKTIRLKRRLQDKFPQFVFHKPKRRYSSEIVFSEDVNQGTVVERALTETDDQSDEDTDHEDEIDEANDCMAERIKNQQRMPLRDLYLVALELRENIRKNCASWFNQWPPLASDITGDSVRKVVSPLLFNFVAWLLAYSDEPEEATYVDIDEKLAIKVFSICQDLIYNNSKGKTQTPKSLALAMSVRQISGCSGLISILNGLGHCVSLSSTMAYDTALAQLTMNSSDDNIPREFVVKEAINLVYDNIDFQEDIKEQTHVTNGIITQKITGKNPSASNRREGVKKSLRSLQVPQSDILPFTIGTRKTPHFLDCDRIPTTPSWEMAQKLDLAYVLLKMFPSDETVLPGWTGFNTILCQDDIPEVSRIGYLPVIDAPPTEYSTINTILKKSEDIANKLQLRYATLVFDEAVYAKIQHVRWKNEAFQNRFVVRLGEFHTSMSFLSAISKIFADGGLKVGLFSI